MFRNAGLNGLTPLVGAPNATVALVKPLAKPVPGEYERTASAKSEAEVETANNPTIAASNERTFFIRWSFKIVPRSTRNGLRLRDQREA